MNPIEETVESFVAPDGAELRYTRRGRGSPGVILVVPGIFVHRDTAEHRLLAQSLAGVAEVATLDVRGHGDSGGAFTWGLREPDDVAALATHLRRDHDWVGGVGFSFGGYHVAVAAGRVGPRLFDAVALVAAPATLLVFSVAHGIPARRLAKSVPFMLRRERRRTRVSLSPFGRRTPPWRVVNRIAPSPLLIVHGTEDWLIPAGHARRLYERAGDPKELLLVPGGLHAEYMLAQDPRPVVDPLVAFFRGITLGSPPRS